MARLGVSVAHTYVTFAQSTPDAEFMHAYDYVTAFEVLERTTNPLETFAHPFSLMKRTGLVVISTLCAFDTAGNGTHKDMLERYAYLSPKVGHVSVFLIRSLQMIAEMHGLIVSAWILAITCFTTQNLTIQISYFEKALVESLSI